MTYLGGGKEVALPRKDGFFPGEAVLLKRSEHTCVYRMGFYEGYGTMTAHKILPGITLIFNEFRTPCGFPEEARCPGLVEINHCQAGRFECTMRNGRNVSLGPQDFAISDMGRPPFECRFPQGIYKGISLVIEPVTAEQAVEQMVGDGAPKLTELFQSLLHVQSFLLLRSEPEIQHIFSELYDVPFKENLAYFRLKTAELMFFLYERQKVVQSKGIYYHSKNMDDRVREIGARLTENLRVHIPLSELAKAYKIGETTIKKYFRQIYGESPYSYLKRRRMEEAAFLLTTSEQSIAQVAEAVGYQNTSKFSSAFRSIYALSPMEYKKENRFG
jgi:AraC-like DNA-binding protein